MQFELRHGDCLKLMRGMADNSVDSIVTDPPYELGFMGKSWDASGVAFNVDVWREALRVLKPGGHLLAFGGSRTYHRMACAIEDAGFEIRDQIMWLYGSGFPKSLDVSKAIDKAAGAEREPGMPGRYASRRPRVKVEAVSAYQDGVGNAASALVTAPATEAARRWQGWGTALKPAHEPICVARKPLAGTVAANVLAHGTGALNIDGCRVHADDAQAGRKRHVGGIAENHTSFVLPDSDHESPAGRWPANLIHDGSGEVLDAFALFGEKTSGKPADVRKASHHWNIEERGTPVTGFGDTGTAARFFYCAKASRKDRGEGNNHPTVKPTDLMRYLCRLVTPPGGLVLDPFMGSGSTGKAAMLEGFRFIGCELSAEYIEISCRRIEDVQRQQCLFEEGAS